MSAGVSRGVTALAALLGHLASGKAIRATEFAVRGGYARSSVFDLARRLQEEGLLVRNDDGGLLAGPKAYELAWSSHGLAGLRGPAEAVLLWLRDHTDGGASLVAGSDELLAVPGPAPISTEQTIQLSLPVLDSRGQERMRLILGPGAHVEPTLASAALGRAAATLEHHLRMMP